MCFKFAGKTTILYKLKDNIVPTSTVPTVGFNVEKLSLSRTINFSVWDVGGQDKLRPLWKYYFKDVSGLFFVVDSSDQERMGEACDELNKLLLDPQIRQIPVVIIANKQDVPSMSLFFAQNLYYDYY